MKVNINVEISFCWEISIIIWGKNETRPYSISC
jgi:hypothetical protein